MYNKVNRRLTNLEAGFNIAGSIPVVGIVSGATRAALAKVQIIVGASLFIRGTFGAYCARDKKILGVPATQRTHCGKDKEHWNAVASFGAEQTIHGALNIFRGYNEFYLSCYGANIGLGIWQIFRDKGFAPVVSYGSIVFSPNYRYA